MHVIPSFLRYAKVRKAFDKPIASMYAIQEKLSKMSVQIESARYVVCANVYV
ncbi:hypothetical protein EON64_06610 [archaeon]|nr:MAG: hypothetical protein EON64_06610 [archaeon]